jgi:hypothetical protein
LTQRAGGLARAACIPSGEEAGGTQTGAVVPRSVTVILFFPGIHKRGAYLCIKKMKNNNLLQCRSSGHTHTDHYTLNDLYGKLNNQG